MPFTFIGTGAIADKPLGAVLHFNGKVYCGNENGGSSKGYIFNPADNTFTTFTLPASAYYPRVLLLDGRILFCPIQYCDKSWLLVNEDGTYQTLNDWTFGVNGASLMRDGKVAICNATSNRFGVFNPKTTYFENFPNIPSVLLTETPISTTLLPDGKLLLIISDSVYPAYIYNPFNNVWEQISLNGFTGASSKGVMLYDGGLAVIGNYHGLNLVDIYSKKIIGIEAMYMQGIGDTTINILICPDGDIFVANLLYINKYNITNNTLTNVGYTTMPTLQRYPKGMVMLPSGKMFYCTNGADLDNNGFTIWDSSLGTLPKEVCLSAFYNRG